MAAREPGDPRCKDCPADHEPGKSRCADCAVKHAAENSKAAKARRKAGLCVKCGGKPKREGKHLLKYCDPCLEYFRRAARDGRAA
jgi:hypothetical protein